MVISRTPYRISFFGGGTDYPAWYTKHGGEVIATTIDKYCYLTCRYLPPFFEHKYRIVYSKIDCTATPEQISHPAARAVLSHLGFDRGLEIHHDGDLPARSGMGSSSSFTIGLLHALYALRGSIPSKMELAKTGIFIEQNLLRETVGSQDQVSAAFGGFNHITFMKNGEISVSPLPVGRERIMELNSYLMLFYTGIMRTSSHVSKAFISNLGNKKQELCALRGCVEKSISILTGKSDLTSFGKLLHRSWELKCGLSSQVSNQAIRRLYASALDAGAIGGKLVGAGGGGFMLLFVPPKKQAATRERFHNLIQVPFKFEFSGSQIIFFDQEKEYSSVEKYWSNRTKPSFYEAAEPLPEKKKKSRRL